MGTTKTAEIERITNDIADAHERDDQMRVWQLLEELERATRRAGNA